MTKKMTNSEFLSLFNEKKIETIVYHDFGNFSEEEIYNHGIQSRLYIVNPDTNDSVYLD
jgi:hypothetical protein